MRILVLDFETSDKQNGKKKRDPSPFLAGNYLVSVGWETHGYPTESKGYDFFVHDDLKGPTDHVARDLQALLDQCELLIAYNAKFELEWLLETGFKYSRNVYCPMVAEYILARGTGYPLDLSSATERRNTRRKLGVLVDSYWDQGRSFNEIPMEIVREYGIRDVECAWDLYCVQQELLKTDEYKSLVPTVEMSNEFIWSLVEMERNGIHIDGKALEDVKKEFTEERNRLRNDLEAIVRETMGDIPINLDSPEQLSWLIYSRKVKDKHAWRQCFNIGTV